MKQFVRLKGVCDMTGLPVSTIYRLMSEERFPKNFRLSGKSVAWDADEVAEWQNKTLAERAKARA